MGRAKRGILQRYIQSTIPTFHITSSDSFTAAAAHFTSPEDPVAPSITEFTQDLTINTISLYASVKEALASFDKLPSSASKTFFYTGNSLNVTPQPALTTLGVGKVASAHVIELASGSYGKKGYQ